MNNHAMLLSNSAKHFAVAIEISLLRNAVIDLMIFPLHVYHCAIKRAIVSFFMNA